MACSLCLYNLWIGDWERPSSIMSASIETILTVSFSNEIVKTFDLNLVSHKVASIRNLPGSLGLIILFQLILYYCVVSFLTVYLVDFIRYFLVFML